MNALLVQYKVSNLRELQEMIEDILASVRASAGRKVSADEIVIDNMASDFLGMNVHFNEQTLTDGSKVYNCEVYQ